MEESKVKESDISSLQELYIDLQQSEKNEENMEWAKQLIGPKINIIDQIAVVFMD